MITIDFETEAIVGNPLVKPPKPVGVAIWIDGHEPEYRPIDDVTRAKLEAIWRSPEELLFHNAPFDLSVAEVHLGLTPPRWTRVHDTMFPLFLADPYADSLSLKPSAERYLGLPPEEQDELKEWILSNVPESSAKNFGAYICRAPFELVGKYAIGDVVRTRQLFSHLIESVPREAYDRERRLSPILTESSRRGLRVDRARLAADIATYTPLLGAIDDAICARTGCPTLNPGSPAQLAAALEQAGLITEFIKTAKGRNSTSKKNLAAVCKDKEILALLGYRGTLETYLGTFMLPWEQYSYEDGRLHTNWNQVKGTEENRKKGTRTGRLSSDHPNFQNMPKEIYKNIPAGFPPLPELRSYILPEEGHRWVMRDFSGQEVRVLAHFEDERLLEAYRENPALDPHGYAQKLIAEKTGVTYDRKMVKITAFTIIYGGGAKKIAQTLGIPEPEAYAIRSAYLSVFPGVRDLQRGTSKAGKIKTWGGREYVTQPSIMKDGRYMSFEYKLLNYLIQGSAADQTKQCLNDWYDCKGDDTIFLATVHDEINISVPTEQVEREMTVLQTAMDQDLFDVPMRSEGFVGSNWAECK